MFTSSSRYRLNLENAIVKCLDDILVITESFDVVLLIITPFEQVYCWANCMSCCLVIAYFTEQLMLSHPINVVLLNKSQFVSEQICRSKLECLFWIINRRFDNVQRLLIVLIAQELGSSSKTLVCRVLEVFDRCAIRTSGPLRVVGVAPGSPST